MKPNASGAAFTHQQIIILVGLALGELDDHAVFRRFPGGGVDLSIRVFHRLGIAQHYRPRPRRESFALHVDGEPEASPRRSVPHSFGQFKPVVPRAALALTFSMVPKDTTYQR